MVKEKDEKAEKAIVASNNDKIEKFKTWCNANAVRKAYLVPLATSNDSFVKIGVYPG